MSIIKVKEIQIFGVEEREVDCPSGRDLTNLETRLSALENNGSGSGSDDIKIGSTELGGYIEINGELSIHSPSEIILQTGVTLHKLSLSGCAFKLYN
jgi:hypothetical protein